MRLRELVARFYAEHVYIPAYVDAGQCGFCEFIENTRATTLEETKAFYYNVGAFAALASALNILSRARCRRHSLYIFAISGAEAGAELVCVAGKADM